MFDIVTVRTLSTFSTQFKKSREVLSIERWPTIQLFPYGCQTYVFLLSNVTFNLRPFPSECANGPQLYAMHCLYVNNNKSLALSILSSLREIKGGGFYLGGNNPQLCLIGNLSSLVTSTSASSVCHCTG